MNNFQLLLIFASSIKSDMKKIIVLLAALLCLACVHAAAQMTDSQVIEYAKSAMSAGKNPEQIARELFQKGVTREQAERIRSTYSQESNTSVTGRMVDRRLTSRSRSGADMVDENAGGVSEADVFSEDSSALVAGSAEIFGHDIFRGRNLTFEPNENAATPENYRLGPGDEVLIEIWGDNEALIDQVISPEGRISISRIGPVQLSGLTIE